MAAQKGKDLLLRIDSDGMGTFATVAGLRSRSIAFNAETVDITNQESSGQWRELLVGAGVKGARVSGAGVFKDAASDALVRQSFFDGTALDAQVVVPDFGLIQSRRGSPAIQSSMTTRLPRVICRLRSSTRSRLSSAMVAK